MIGAPNFSLLKKRFGKLKYHNITATYFFLDGSINKADQKLTFNNLHFLLLKYIRRYNSRIIRFKLFEFDYLTLNF